MTFQPFLVPLRAAEDARRDLNRLEAFCSEMAHLMATRWTEQHPHHGSAATLEASLAQALMQPVGDCLTKQIEQLMSTPSRRDYLL